ncbi:hypothetical protein GGI07_002036 [Coemansia sp. Benny D115]|nr:hypothetical protein GGI07_002036 [Coemansia sp. Benny D115]
MGFKKPKTRKGNAEPNYNEDNTKRDLDPTKNILSGGGKVAKSKNRNTSDAPKAFQHIMQFMAMKQRKDQQQTDTKKKPKPKEPGPKLVTENLSLMPGESLKEFDKRVNKKMQNNMQIVGAGISTNESTPVNNNPSRDDGEVGLVSKRSERKKRNDAVRKERRMAKKAKNQDSDDEEYAGRSNGPKFGEQAQAPPIFKTLPKETFKKMVPLANSKEAQQAKKQREEVVAKKLVEKSSRLSPLERMQMKRKAKMEGGGRSAAEKRIMEEEREKAVRRYRMLRVARETANTKKTS